MSPFLWALRLVHAFEDRIIQAVRKRTKAYVDNNSLTCPQILRQPGFHRAVGRIHRAIHEQRHGRNPHEPLAPGEATADPERSATRQSFIRHFVDELRNQARGNPTDLANKRPPK
ncbi:hypothetical protein EsDP_00000524 [Epichloe bromicola]|uniref:Uncharacterized protein n=1 Tax=Epichloe bromicola TaxID=79588 RepID=A0ABQ0CF63_9HYPO